MLVLNDLIIWKNLPWVAALLIHSGLLVVERVDHHEAFVPVGCQVAKAGSVVQL